MSLTTLDPRTALVVIDLQQGIVATDTAPHTTAEVVDRSVRLADAFRGHDLPVVLVRVSFAPDGADAPPGRTARGASGRTYPEGWDQLLPELGEGIVVTKRNWGAFHGTDLDLHLRRRGVTQVVITGVATRFGVESTARAAHEHGYHVTLVEDAMADRDADGHRASVEGVFPGLGEIGTTDEVIDLLSRPRR
jgi:nicotinamidase-related amidase